MAASSTRSPRRSATHPESPGLSSHQREPAVEDFLEHLRSNTLLTVEATSRSSTTCRRSFVPISTLRRYLTDGRIRSILVSSHLDGSVYSQIRSSYLRVFTVLVCIDKLPWIGNFLADPRLSDTFLPFFHNNDWRASIRGFFQPFHDAQWKFCAQDLEPNRLNGQFRIDERVIIPIVDRRTIKIGVDSTSTQVEIHPDYNNLVVKVTILPP